MWFFDYRSGIGDQLLRGLPTLREKGVLRFVQSYVPDWLRQAARALGALYLPACCRQGTWYLVLCTI